MKPKNVYLICPVRRATPEQQRALNDYVDGAEATGEYLVHYPPRDVDQSNDDGGIRICRQHLEAMKNVDEVWVFWDDSSTGCHFDLGMAYMLVSLSKRHIPVKLVNGVTTVPAKSFQNVLVALAAVVAPPPDLAADSGERFLEELDAIAEEDAEGLKVAYQSYGPSWKSRGGSGAFMMLARKWDRMENRVKKTGCWDIFHAIATDTRGEGIIDDVRDLRRYLMLVEAEMRARGFRREHRDNQPQPEKRVHRAKPLGVYNG